MTEAVKSSPFCARAARAPAAGTAAHQVGEDVLEAGALAGMIVEAELESTGARARIVPAAAERIALAEAAALTESLAKTLARIEALGIAVRPDGAGIELGALVLVAQDVIGAADLLEFLLCRGVARMLVG